MTSLGRAIDSTDQNMDRDLALIALTPEQISRRKGLAFGCDEDDLGSLSYLLFRVDDDFLLEHHDDGPAGTVLRSDYPDTPALASRRLHQAIDALGITDGETLWRTPLAGPPATRTAVAAE